MILKNLIKNTIIFAFGNIISKSLFIILLPILTGYYNTDEFGKIDLFIMMLSLFIVILGFNSTEFLIKDVSKNINNNTVIKETLNAVLFLNNITSLFLISISIIFYTSGYYFLLYVALASSLQVTENTLKQFHRSIDNNIVYVSSEIIYTTIFSFILLTSISYDLGYEFYFLSVIIALLFNISYLLLSKKIFRFIHFNIPGKKKLLEIIKFSFPLMLNSIMWYLINLGNRYFLIFFIGISAAGILAANSRIPLMIVLLYSYVYKALQIIIYRDETSNSKPAINLAFGLLFTIVILLSIFNEQITNLLLSSEYQSISNWIPLMYLSSIFSSYSSILGINYMISNTTSAAFRTSLMCAFVSVIGNVTFIPLFGIPGAIISICISFLTLIIIRIITIKDLIVAADTYKFFVSSFIVLIIFIIIHSCNNNYFLYIIGFTLLILNILIYFKDLINMRRIR